MSILKKNQLRAASYGWCCNIVRTMTIKNIKEEKEESKNQAKIEGKARKMYLKFKICAFPRTCFSNSKFEVIIFLANTVQNEY